MHPTWRGRRRERGIEPRRNHLRPDLRRRSGSTIALGSTLYVTKPVEILDSVTGGVPDASVQVSGTAFQISAAETVIEGLGIEASSIGVQILGGLGAKIRDNFISGTTATTPQAGVEVNGGSGSTGNLIEGNQIKGARRITAGGSPSSPGPTESSATRSRVAAREVHTTAVATRGSTSR